MILAIKQVTNGIQPTFLVANAKSGEEVAHVTSKGMQSTTCDIRIGDMRYLTRFTPLANKPEGRTLKERLQAALAWYIYEDDGNGNVSEEPIGLCVGDFCETGPRKLGIFSQGYDFARIELYDRKYRGYRIGHGQEGSYFCVYDEQDVEVACIHHKVMTKNYLDEYTAYISNDCDATDVDAIINYCIYADFATTANSADQFGASRDAHHFVTNNKDLNAKFDSDFIQNIIDEEA